MFMALMFFLNPPLDARPAAAISDWTSDQQQLSPNGRQTSCSYLPLDVTICSYLPLDVRPAAFTAWPASPSLGHQSNARDHLALSVHLCWARHGERYGKPWAVVLV